MRPEFLAALAAYWIVLAAVGLRLKTRETGLAGYFLGGRRLGAAAIALSLTVSWFGASSILVSAGEARAAGVSAFWLIGLPAVLTLLVFAAGLTRRVHALPTLTLPEFMTRGYGPATGGVSAALVVWYMTVLAASQLTAVGVLLADLFGGSRLAAMAAAAGFVLLYSLAGGFLSIVRTHVVQFAFLAAGLAALLAALFRDSSLPRAAAAARALGRDDYFRFFANAETNVWIALSFTLAWIISPIAWQRIQAGRSAASARRGVLAAAGLLGGLYAAVVLIGILCLPLFADIGAADALIPRYIDSVASPALGALLFVTALAAILSTLDTAVNAGAFSLSRDVLQRALPKILENRTAALGRTATALVAAAALLVASSLQGILQTLGLASEVMAEGFFIPGVAFLVSGRRRPAAGGLALLLGGGFSIASYLTQAGLVSTGIPAWPRSLPYGLALGLAGFLIGCAWEAIRARRRSPAPQAS